MAPDRYVLTKEIRVAVRGHEATILAKLGVPWRDGDPHIACPYRGHDDQNPSWPWDEAKARAHCTCIRGSDSVFDVVMKVDGVDFEAAKLVVAEALSRHDLIRTRDGARRQATDAASLLRPPPGERDDALVRAYLGHRLGVAPDDVPMPGTPVVGWRALAYYDPPKGTGTPKLVGHFPCAVFGTVGADGRRHAHRIYLAAGGGKAELGTRADGRLRDPKKSAKVVGDDSTAGRAVLWGEPRAAPHLIVAEGIETAAAIALAYRAEIEAGGAAVAAAVTAGGVEAFAPYPATKRVTVAADRDEAPDKQGTAGYRRGERAARAFGVAHHGRLEVGIALPGAPGEKVDWLDILRRDGDQAVRAGLAGAEPFTATPEEIEDARRRADRAAELAEVERTYPLPTMESLTLAYRHTRSGRVMVHRYAGKDKAGEEIWLPVATPFGVPARLRHADQADAYGRRLTVQDMQGRPRAVEFERAALPRLGAAEIRAQLFAAGLRTEGDGEAIAVQALKAADPPHEIVAVSRPGWHRLQGLADPVFVTPGGAVFGAPDGVALELTAGARLADPVAAGTLEGWLGAVAAAGCPHWTLGALAGFAGPVLALTELDSCGLNLSGLSSSGKTFAQRLAVSAWGSPRLGAGLLQSMRTTENALESLAQVSGGTVLALDEMAHADGGAVGRMIYSIAGGLGKARMTAGAALRGRASWSTFALLSGECSLAERVRADGGTWTAGMAVRIADVDVTGVDRAVAPATLEAVGAVGQHFGQAGPAFVRALVAGGCHRGADALRERVLAAARRIAGRGADSARIRAAAPFALLFVAGELARSFALLPAATPVAEAVGWAWRRFVTSADATALAPDEEAITHLRAWIAERWDVTIRDVEAGSTGAEAKRVNNREAAGWYDAEAVYLPMQRLREAAGQTLKEQHVAKVLGERELLARCDPKRLTVRYVPRIGYVSCYALRRSAFGRSDRAEEPEFTVYEGGRR